MQMDPSGKPSGCISALDQKRLVDLIERTFAGGQALDPAARTVLQRLRNSGVIAQPDLIPPTLVTMNSTIRLNEEASGREWEITLVYPEDHEPAESCWSVLSPVGAALFGLSVGDVAEIPDAADAAGAPARWRIVAIPFQPEARGFLTM